MAAVVAVLRALIAALEHAISEIEAIAIVPRIHDVVDPEAMYFGNQRSGVYHSTPRCIGLRSPPQAMRLAETQGLRPCQFCHPPDNAFLV